MKWLNDSDIIDFLQRNNYDIRVSHNARWIDQKCTADVLTIVSDCILQYVNYRPNILFSSTDIWHDEYTVKNVSDIFMKPSPNEKKARNEYDKYFQQPMEMLANAGVLRKEKQGLRNYYTIKESDVLEYISIRERNALTFIQLYISKVLADSDIMPLFDDFFQKQTKVSYDAIKDGFTNFTIRNTPINGETECRRIFTKVLNPLAFQKGKRGTERGLISKHIITYDMLMYNRDNFRDIYAKKPKNLTRGQYVEQDGYAPSAKLSSYMSQKAKRLVRRFNDEFRDSRTEVFDERHSPDGAVHIHHIFPEAQFPEICAFCENLIALTPTQHFIHAHPQGNTGRIDIQFQHLCLIAKLGTIKETLQDKSRSQIYDFGRFMYVCQVGLDDDAFMNIGNDDFDGAITAINLAYADTSF